LETLSKSINLALFGERGSPENQVPLDRPLSRIEVDTGILP
jgi:hypothetical protein